MAQADSGLAARRQGALAGMVGAALFVVVFLIEGWVRPGYSAAGMFVSELSRGPRGWIQVANFIVSGALIFLFGRGLAAALGRSPSGRVGALFVQLIGIALLASGPFVTDPSTIFEQHTVPGLVHGIFGAVVFSLAPTSCLVLSRAFRGDPAWRGLAIPSFVVGVILIVGVVVLKVAEQPSSSLFGWKGLIQRATLVVFLGWVFGVAAHLGRK